MVDFAYHAYEPPHARRRPGPRAHQLTEPSRRPPPSHAFAVPHDLLRLQRRAGNRATSGLVVQRMSEDTVKQNMRTQGSMALLKAGFIQKHGQGAVTNAGAAEIHGRRPDPPVLNTVIRDSTELIDEIKNVAFTDGGDHWSVSTARAIGIIETRRRAAADALAGQPVAQLLPGDFEDYFKIDSGRVEPLPGAPVTPADLQVAATAVGAYPPRNAGTNKKVAHRRAFMQKIREVLAAKHASGLATWISQGFQTINGWRVPQQGLTVDAVNAVPPRSKRVTVHISKQDGTIFHLARTF